MVKAWALLQYGSETQGTYEQHSFEFNTLKEAEAFFSKAKQLEQGNGQREEEA